MVCKQTTTYPLWSKQLQNFVVLSIECKHCFQEINITIYLKKQLNSLSSLLCILSFSLSLFLSLRLRHCQSPKNIFYELSYHFSHFSLVRNRFQKHTGQKIPLLFSNLTDTWKKWFLKGYHVSTLQLSYDIFVEKKF